MNKKTNAMRILDAAKIKYKQFEFDSKEALSGVEVAKIIDVDQDRLFKTLVTQGNNRNYYVFLVPSAKTLDLKKAASSVNVKKLEMVKSASLLGITGYVHGGCSPIGMKKTFETIIDMSSKNYNSIVFSAGKIGYQIELSLEELHRVLDFSHADLTIE